MRRVVHEEHTRTNKGDKNMIKIKVLQEFLRDSRTNSNNLVPLSDLVSQYDEVLLDSPYMTLSLPFKDNLLFHTNNKKDFDSPYCDKDFPGTVYKGVLSDIFKFLEDMEIYCWNPYAFKFGRGWFCQVNYSKNKEFDPETIISAVKPTGLVTSAKPLSYMESTRRVLGRFEYKTGEDKTLYYIGSYRTSGFFRKYAAMLISQRDSLDMDPSDPDRESSSRNMDKSKEIVNSVLKSQEISDLIEVLKYYYDLGYKKVYYYDTFSGIMLVSVSSISTFCRNLPNRNYKSEENIDNKELSNNIVNVTKNFLKCFDKSNYEESPEYELTEYGKSLGITEHEERVLKVLRSCFDLREKCVTIEKLESTGLARDELARCFGSLMMKIDNFQVMFFNLAPISNILFGETLVYNLKVMNFDYERVGKWDFSNLNKLPVEEQLRRSTFKRI